MAWWSRLIRKPKRQPPKSLEVSAALIASLIVDSAATVVQFHRDHLELSSELDEERSNLLFIIGASVLLVETQRLLWEGLVESDKDATRLEKLVYSAFEAELAKIESSEFTDVFSYVNDYVAHARGGGRDLRR